MSKQAQAAENQADKKNKPQIEPVASPELTNNPAGLAPLPGGLLAANGSGSIEAQATRLANPHWQSAQRQALAGQIGRVQGNRHLQRIVTSLQSTQKTTPSAGDKVKPQAGLRIQPKLTVNPPGDVYEQEADQMADQVMRMPEPAASDQPPVSGQSIVPEENALQAQTAGGHVPEVTPDVEARIQSLPGRGQPLPESERAFFEPRFGRDFSQVQLHTDATAAETAQAINARAFTVGGNIAFGAGQYAPGTTEGRRLLAHELTHVVQQANPQAVQTSVQREPDQDDVEKMWQDVNGNAFISEVKAGISEWINFRKNPRSGQHPMPGSSANTAISSFTTTLANQFGAGSAPPALRSYAAQKLGSKDIKYLQEMVSIWGAAGFGSIGDIFNISPVDPGHTYTIKIKGSEQSTVGSIAEFLLKKLKLTTAVTVEYKNKFGWAWSKELHVGGLSVGVSVSYGGSGLDMLLKGKKPELKAGSSTLGKPLPVNLGALSIAIDGSATADPINRYWGLDDLAGVVGQVTGPSAKLQFTQFEIKGQLGAMLVFEGGLDGNLTFKQIEMSGKGGFAPTEPLKTDPSKGSLIGKLKLDDFKGEISLVNEGGGYATDIGGDETVHAAPELQPKIKLVDETWSATIDNFETGFAKLPAGGAETIQNLHQQIQARKLKMWEQAEELRELEVEPEKNFHLEFKVIGRASRVGETDSNQGLAEARADSAVAVIDQLFGQEDKNVVAWGEITTTGGVTSDGYWDWPKDADGNPDTSKPMIWVPGQQSQTMGQAEAEKHLAKEKERARQEEKDPTALKMREKALEHNYGAKANEGQDRRVELTITWHGKEVEYGFGSTVDV